MMGFYALFRLLSWQSFVFLVFQLGLAFVLVLLLYKDEPFPGVPRPGRLNLFTLLCSAFVGNFLGGVVAGLQRCWFSWTLPDLRRQLFPSVVFTGIITAFLVAWVYKWFGGPASWVPTFTSALLWYSMGIAYGWYFVGMFGTLMNDVLHTSVRHIRSFGFMIFTLLVLVLAGFSINRIAELYSTQPLLCILLTVVGASLYLHRIFGSHAAREISLFPTLAVSETIGGFSAKLLMALKRISGRKWEHTGPITGLFNWIRAGEYENFGFVRGGWMALAVLFWGIAVLIVTTLAYHKGYKMGSHEMGIQVMYHAIFDSSSFKKNTTVLVSFFPAMLVFFHGLSGSLFLKSGWLYPLSRTQLARLAYWSGLLYNAVFCGIMLLTFHLTGSLIWLYAGYDTPFKLILDFIRPLILMFIFSPFLSWMRLRYGLSLLSVGGGFLIFPFGVGTLGTMWLEMGSGISGTYEVAACAGLILLSQCLYRYKVETYFRRADLV